MVAHPRSDSDADAGTGGAGASAFAATGRAMRNQIQGVVQGKEGKRIELN